VGQNHQQCSPQHTGITALFGETYLVDVGLPHPKNIPWGINGFPGILPNNGGLHSDLMGFNGGLMGFNGL